jgi:N-hydroxyarylamine O-acetyltransferase
MSHITNGNFEGTICPLPIINGILSDTDGYNLCQSGVLMETKNTQLHPELVEQILRKLGFADPPPLNITGLTDMYRAWCNRVPFDNIRKRIHLTASNPLPLPGFNDVEFFQGWLRFGVGGLCWAGNAALHSLLDALGFSCSLGTATMLADSNQPPNHGTVFVGLEEKLFLVDASMLHDTPLLLVPNQVSTIAHPAWGLSCSPHQKLWNIRWRPLHMVNGCDCRLEKLSVSRDTFRKFNEITRSQSPFNDSLYARINREEGVLGITESASVNFTVTGETHRSFLSPRKRLKYLIEKIGIKDEIAAQIPPDRFDTGTMYREGLK